MAGLSDSNARVNNLSATHFPFIIGVIITDAGSKTRPRRIWTWKAVEDTFMVDAPPPAEAAKIK
jgi:hypothetical protein